MNSLKRLWHKLNGHSDTDIHMVDNLSDIEGRVRYMRRFLGTDSPERNLQTPKDQIEFIIQGLELFKGEYDNLYRNKAEIYNKIDAEWESRKASESP